MSAARPGHRVTTRHAQAIYPFTAGGGLGGRGAFIGRDTSGGAFCFDPWVLYDEGALDDPNAIVIGKLGQGKSALVKTLLWRMLLFGRRAFVLDVKREYGPLCASVGRQAGLARSGRRRQAEPALGPSRGARPDRAAAGDRHHRDRRTARPGRGGGAARGAAHGQEIARRSRRFLRSAAIMFDPPAEMAGRLQTTPARLAADSPTRRARAPGPLRGPAEGDLRWPDEPGPRPRRAAAGARPARRARLAGGRHPDGLRDRLDERPARPHRRAAQAAAG